MGTTTPRAPSAGIGWLSRWPIHPALAAAYPVLFMFVANVDEHLSLDPIWAPLGAAVGGAALLLVVARLVTRDWLRAGLITTLVIAFFFGYGHVWDLVSETLRLHRYLLAAWGALLLVGVVVALRLPPRALRAGTAGLNVLAAVLVALNVPGVVDFALETASATARAEGELPTARTVDRRPDIYYLIFDRYGSERTLAQSGFDNRPFLDDLEARGFYVADDSHANYVMTALSLASSLDASYLDLEALEAEARNGSDWRPTYRRLVNGLTVQEFLLSQGYEYVHLGSRVSFTATNSAATVTISYDDSSEFANVLADSTLLTAGRSFGVAATGDLRRYAWLHTEHQLDQLASVASRDGPKFVFAHVLLPHGPFVFDADGEYVSESEARARPYRQKLADQLTYANRRIIELLEITLSGREDNHPVVIVQGDEGLYPQRYIDDPNFDWRTATAEEIARKFGILNAYYLPGVDVQAVLYPSISPVNSFRVVFNEYFGTDLRLLDDRAYAFQSRRHLYTAVDVTDKFWAAVGRP